MKFYLAARDNTTLLLKDAGIERDMESFTSVKRLNALGSWALQLRAESVHAATFQRDGSGNLKNGIIVQLDNEDGQGLHTVFTGVQTDVDMKLTQDQKRVLLITGDCDKHWLNWRRAFQVPHYPYTQMLTSSYNALEGNTIGVLEPGWSFLVTPANIPAYLPLDDTSGASARNIGAGGGGVGTYNGGFTLNKPGLIDDPNTCTLFNGTTGYVSVPTASMRTGNGAWSFWGWGMLTANPAADIILWSFGGAGASAGYRLGVNSSGMPFFGASGFGDNAGSVAVPLNQPFLLGVTYDGSTVTGYQFSSTQQGSFLAAASGALAIAFGTANIGSLFGASNFWPGFLGQCGAAVVTLPLATFQTMYAVGQSRQSYIAYDAINLAHASSLLIWYVQRNAAATALPAANNGRAAPIATYSDWQETHTARPIPNLSIAADPLLGSAVTGAARQDNLLDLLGALALQSTPELGFDLTQVGSQLSFTVFQPTDRTSKAVFKVDRKNISEYHWHDSIGQGNHVIAGGANPVAGSTNLQDRLFGENESATSISQTWYREGFLDYRQASTGPTLQQAITGQLAIDARQVNVNIVALPGAQPYYYGPGDSGFNLGDIVTVIVDGQTFAQIIREVQIDLQPNQAPLITPAIGTPIAATIINEYDAIMTRLKALGVATSLLKTNY